MTQYKITLQLNETELNILYDAVKKYSDVNDINEEYTNEDVCNLVEKIDKLYIEEDSAWQLSNAAKVFIDQFGIDELMNNPEKWESFRESYIPEEE